MLVYGDHQELAEPESRAREINRRLDTIEQMAPGIDRHGRLVGALVDSGQLLQGLADAQFAASQCDCRTASLDELGDFLLALAGAVCGSWDSGLQEIGGLPRLKMDREWPLQVELRLPEGFAFYALYPEAYVEAARRLKLAGPARVIGIRSIGTSLAAAVAAALGAVAAVTVRPFGDPSARRIAIDPSLERELLDARAHYVIVDEGPGQSGSSFGAVVDWLRERGVPLDRVALLPSHSAPPGPASTEAQRRLWRSLQREAGDFGQRWPELIVDWCTDVFGLLDSPPQEISGGAWRHLHYADQHQWPPVVAAWERRKFLVRSGGQSFLVKFAGLGRIGEEKLALARLLHGEGFIPEPIGLVHGFLVERWSDDASPLSRDETPLAELARYIGTRARLLPAEEAGGASVDELLVMARRNISLEFGDKAARALQCWSRQARELGRRIVRVRTDNKLELHEWLRTKSGRLIKADALDHHRAHDLIGCQDLAWDVAGATVEFDVGQKDSDEFVASVEHWAGHRIDRQLLEFCRVAYLAFRLGQARFGEPLVGDRNEQQRLSRVGDRYAAELQDLLESTQTPTRLESWVD